ncbi:methionine synthase [Marinitoga sp. 1135]|uniref:methionine synthase n=1 Tax=unclassified Marinitoga TaxID=2640159 RepID=UPI00158649AF|nr:MULTISPECIES: methionine synthase [unclassified Marinitoga]NUU96156.1 methionine synthase [Marinitoga sp. 1135]NUU98064.1 methionine synthase [Marinitoga sp. 1138]
MNFSEIEEYIPQKSEYMPSKQIYLARAGSIYKKIIDDENLNKIATEIYLKGLELASPQLWHNLYEINKVPKEIIPSKFVGSKKLSIFLSTLGERIDKEIESLMERNKVLEGTLLDAWASEALEKLNNTFDQKLRTKYGKGTMRFSPGYGDIDIRVNKIIVEMLNLTDKIMVRESGIMIPGKTTTCLIGW